MVPPFEPVTVAAAPTGRQPCSHTTSICTAIKCNLCICTYALRIKQNASRADPPLPLQILETKLNPFCSHMRSVQAQKPPAPVHICAMNTSMPLACIGPFMKHPTAPSSWTLLFRKTAPLKLRLPPHGLSPQAFGCSTPPTRGQWGRAPWIRAISSSTCRSNSRLEAYKHLHWPHGPVFA